MRSRSRLLVGLLGLVLVVAACGVDRGALGRATSSGHVRASSHVHPKVPKKGRGSGSSSDDLQGLLQQLLGGSGGGSVDDLQGLLQQLLGGGGGGGGGGLAGLTGGGPGRTGVHAGTLDWKGCDDGFECASMSVPVDHAQPNGRKLRLGLVRVPAADPAHRIGSLVVNPGGPGGSAVDFVEQAWSMFPKQVTDRFDIVGFDPRGVGRSSALDCHANIGQLYSTDQSPDSKAEVQRLLDVSRTYVKGCDAKYHDLLPYLGTEQVARDMDDVRRAVGDDKLTYVGFSYGTSIGQEYARLFPQRIRAMVLDGAVELGMSGLATAQDQARAFQRGIEGFARWCHQSSSSCGLGQDAVATIRKVQAEAERTPIPASTASRPAGPAEVTEAIEIGMYNTQYWPMLAQALASAEQGDGSAVVMLADMLLGKDPLSGGQGNGYEVYFGVSCVDWSWPHDPQAVLDAGRRAAKDSPIVGEDIVDDYVRCAMWPTPPKPLSGGHLGDTPPVVVVDSTGDPATPFEWGQQVARRFDQASLLVRDGYGHTAFAQGDSCVDRAVASYLVDRRPPKDGTRCS